MTEQGTALAGVILESSPVRFKPAMAISSDEMASSFPSDSWDSACMIKIEGNHEKEVRL